MLTEINRPIILFGYFSEIFNNRTNKKIEITDRFGLSEVPESEKKKKQTNVETKVFASYLVGVHLCSWIESMDI